LQTAINSDFPAHSTPDQQKRSIETWGGRGGGEDGGGNKGERVERERESFVTILRYFAVSLFARAQFFALSAWLENILLSLHFRISDP
jgi:hypothetical protein